MNQFKIGDKVKFIDNELNRAEIMDCLFKKSFPISDIVGSTIKLNMFISPSFHVSRFTLAEPAIGSKEWAKQMLLEGKCVAHYLDGDADTYWKYEPTDEEAVQFSMDNSFELRRHRIECFDNTLNSGWQLYAPAKFKDVKVGLEKIQIELTKIIETINKDEQ